MTDRDSVDFQHRGEREDVAVLAALDRLDACPPGPLLLNRSLRALRRQLQLTKAEWRKLRSRLLWVYGFQLLVAKSRQEFPSLIEVQMPRDVLNELIDRLPTPTGTDGITSHTISLRRGSAVDRWVRETYLPQAKRRYRGVTGYRAHVRYAFNSGAPQDWDERFVTPHANFHWDQACNSFPFVLYLSNVGPNDGPFSVFVDSLDFRPNLYLAAYDRYVTDRDGLDSHVASDTVGRYLEVIPPAGIREFTGPKGLGIMFAGRSVVHDGGFPSAGGHRLVIFFNARVPIMGLLDRFFLRD